MTFLLLGDRLNDLGFVMVQDFLPERSFFQRELSKFAVELLVERGLSFELEFEKLSKIQNEPYCGIETADKKVRIELYVDSANIVTFFGGEETAICLECYTGHSPIDVAEEFREALPLVLKGYESVPGEKALHQMEDKGVQGRWVRFFKK